MDEGDAVEVILSKTCFYVESGGQVSDTGIIHASQEPEWDIEVTDTRKPAAGVIVHVGKVVKGRPQVDDDVIAKVDVPRRQDIMRNHTATHLLHAELHKILGEHARQAGSLVAPDRLRFDFTHPEAIDAAHLEKIEAGVNGDILNNYHLNIISKPLVQAISEGAMALFGEKYGDTVRTITIGEDEPISYELCGGTHVGETGDIGLFLITSEGSTAAGVRRIEAVTGRNAYELVQKRFRILKQTAGLMGSAVDDVMGKTQALIEENEQNHKQINKLRQDLVAVEFATSLNRSLVPGFR